MGAFGRTSVPDTGVGELKPCIVVLIDLRFLEYVVVADSSPAEVLFAFNGNKLESGSTVRARERPSHFHYSGRSHYAFNAQRFGPNCFWISCDLVACWRELLGDHFTKSGLVFTLEFAEVAIERGCLFEFHEPLLEISSRCAKKSSVVS